VTVRTFPEILQGIWSALENGRRSAKHPFHAPAVATVRDGGPRVRTVVLQSVDPEAGTVSFHADLRSPKVADIRTTPAIGWVFYDREHKIQVRLSSTAEIHAGDDIANDAWDRMRPVSRRRYGPEVAPGRPGTSAGFGLPDLDDLDRPVPGSPDLGRENFCVVRCAVQEIDWLFLRIEQHTRARFTRGSDEWVGEWIAP
jgi:pyridoxamine 5'-phosphate oxidase